MDVTHFVSPLETLQAISILSHLNTLSDFLYTENCLLDNSLNKPIPVVNALYKYIHDTKYSTLNHQDRKLKVVRRLIKGSDLYGSKDDEQLDLYFVNKTINHLVESLVFDKFSNVYGFIAESILFGNSDSLIPVLHRIKKILVSLTFENEYGEDSQLEPLAIKGIYRDLILPLFPQLTYNNMYANHLSSVDYIYAQAGSAFIRSGQTQTELVDDSDKFQEYIQVAHTVEQLVLAKKLNASALKIFALPALINYVLIEQNLRRTHIQDIINSPEHWENAYIKLFTRLNGTFSLMEEMQKRNYKYQFYAALNHYNNRTTLAKEAIEINCPPLTESEMEEEIKKYKNNHDDYKCKGGSENKLDDLNKHFQELVDNIADKYFIFEKESCRAAFGKDFIKSMDNTNVEISKGLIRYYFTGSISIFDTPEEQLVKKENDLLQFYFPDNDTYSYYALVRNGYHVSMIKEAGNPTLFRETIGLERDQPFRPNFFPTVLKTKTEKFEDLLTKIANERKKLFTPKLQSGFDYTAKERWIEFGMSLIPFYTCVKDIEQGKIEEASLICPIDAAIIVPIMGEIGYLATKISQAISKSVFTLTETTMRTMTLRTTMRTALRITGRVLMDEVQDFKVLFSIETFKGLGLSILRFIDPGFELAFTIGKGGIRSIKTLSTLATRKFFILSSSLNAMLETSTKVIENSSKTIGKKFRKNIYVNCITSKEFGYGYKFIRLQSGKVAEIRTLWKKETALVRRISEKQEKVYNEVSLETEELIGKDYFIDEEDKVSEARTFEVHFQEQPSEVLVENGNFLKTKVKSFILKNKVFSDAVNLARRERFLPESTIRNELKNYAFPETGRTEVNFVSEWIRSNELQAPVWAKEFRVTQPELYFQLKYKEVLDNPRLTASEAVQRINDIYVTDSYAKIREELPVESILKDFMDRHAYKYVRFEDYYALRYYGGSGYLKMAGSSDEARRMKNAIYRLAIRQAEYPEEIYVRRLVRGESRITEAIEKELAGKKTFEFTRFTSVSTDVETAVKYSQKGDPTQTRVFYDMTFDDPMIRARVEQLFVKDEKETILLPGTKFNIDTIERSTELTDSGVRRNVIKVHMTHLSSAEPKVQRLNVIMKEIDKLTSTNTKFYSENLID